MNSHLGRAVREGKIKVGSTALHALGDISREGIPDDMLEFKLIHVDDESEDGEHWVGNWVAGLGFVNVHFPKDTVRELTPAEAESLAGKEVHLP